MYNITASEITRIVSEHIYLKIYKYICKHTIHTPGIHKQTPPPSYTPSPPSLHFDDMFSDFKVFMLDCSR